jgi:hypothetical protein
MRGEEVSRFTGDVDRHFLEASARGVVTIGIGDGGNEIGMGNVKDKVVQHVRNGPIIASIVEVDFLVVAGTSNWGAWALLAELSRLAGKMLLTTVEESRSTLASCVDAGAVDAISKTPTPIVDGLSAEVYFRPLMQLHTVVGEAT